MAGRDITEGRSTRAIAVDLGIVSSSAVWENTAISYDVAVGGLPFFYAISDERPYIRQDRKSTRLNSSHVSESRMPSSA